MLTLLLCALLCGLLPSIFALRLALFHRRLLSLLLLRAFLLLRGSTSFLFRLSLVSLLLSLLAIFLASFLAATTTSLRLRHARDADKQRKGKHRRRCEASIVCFHCFPL